MKQVSILALGVSGLVATAGMAFAGGVVETLPEIVVVPEPVAAPSFAGLYAGAEGGLASGTLGGDISDYIENDEDFADVEGDFEDFGDIDGSAYGAFLGYNFQSGNLVYGAEARMMHFGGADTTASYDGYYYSGDVTFELENVVDLRVRAGYVVGEAMLYGAAGVSYASGQITDDYVGEESGVDTSSVSANGFNLGVGAEMNLGSNVFVGVDYTIRGMSGDWDGSPDFDLHANTLTARIGWRF